MGHAQYPSYLHIIKAKPAAFLSGSPGRNFVSRTLFQTVSLFGTFRHSSRNSDENSVVNSDQNSDKNSNKNPDKNSDKNSDKNYNENSYKNSGRIFGAESFLSNTKQKAIVKLRSKQTKNVSSITFAILLHKYQYVPYDPPNWDNLES